MQLQIIAIEPPGNLARDLALFRRELFARLGEGSALAFPEVLPLAFSARAERSAPEKLAECWKGVEGSFSSAGTRISRGLLYLAMNGPIEELSTCAAAALGRQISPTEDAPFEMGKGVFLCRPSDPALAMREADLIGTPRVQFSDCSLLLIDLRLGAESFSAATWRELARAKRRSGRWGHRIA